jgi:hypothetical protein
VQVVRASHLVLSSLIPVSYLLASAIWSISTLGWIATRLRSPCLGQWYIYILLATTFWAFQGVTAAELFLAFLPLSVSIGVCLYTICGGPIVNPPTCKRCARGQDGYERPTSIAVPPIQDPYSRKSALEVSRQDLEIIVKG